MHLTLTGMEEGLFRTTISLFNSTTFNGSSVTGGSCLWNFIASS